MIDPSRYGGYLRPWLGQIIRLHKLGLVAAEICREMYPVWGAEFELRNWDLPTPEAIKYALRRVGAMPPAPEALSATPRAVQVATWMEEGVRAEEIADRLVVSRARVYQLQKQAQRHLERTKRRKTAWERNGRIIEEWLAEQAQRKHWGVTNKGRPIDMGGPRDVWLDRDPWSDL